MDENTKEAFKQFYKYQIKIFELNCESLEWQHKMQAHLRGFADGLGFEHDANTQTPYLKNFKHDENTQAKYVKRLELAQSLRELKAHGFVCSDDRQFFLANDAYRKVLEQNNEIAQATHGSTRNTAADAPHGSTQKTTNLINFETKTNFNNEKEKITQNNVMSNAQTVGGNEDLKYLTKRADGRWSGRKTIDGVRVGVYGKTQAECNEKLKAYGKHRETTLKQQSLYNFTLWWLKTYKTGNISKTTEINYKYSINKHMKINTPLNKITTLQLQEMLNKLPASRIREEVYKLIRQVFKKAYKLSFIKKDVSSFLSLGKIETHERKALNIEDQRKLVGALTNDMFSLRTIFYLCTGARPAEIRTVLKSELRPGWLKINGTKTKKAVRWVKVSNKLVEIIKGQPDDFFEFNSKRYREHLQKFCINLGITADVDIYVLRHTFATNLYILGVAEKDRQVYMGHTAGSSLTNDIYTTFSPDVCASDITAIYGDMYPCF